MGPPQFGQSAFRMGGTSEGFYHSDPSLYYPPSMLDVYEAMRTTRDLPMFEAGP